ncbi:glycosyltransferase family 2 protein [Oribacterium sp. WCC10]|uniref:glycosyltransferase family 2 protein n=1 Tax=Oribacterium sp. WCC10 TaxID=1855343 RepID=UPI0008ECCED3|nr:glycosyltransferase family 2 protein [Oribacterium sp. WCC10]SFG36657.1 Glycosyl transferase family 2 [Oribacterium sp. WCC10]
MCADMKCGNDNKILTVSVAAYNVENTIGRTLDSLVKNVPEEVLNALEVIVVNDGSGDGTLNLVKKYEESYPGIIRIIDKENGGWGSTVNASLREAKGKYYRLLDGDDCFVTENLVDYLRFLKESAADLVLTPFIKRYPDRDIEENNHAEIGHQVVTFSKLDASADIYMHEITVKTDKIRNIGFDITEKCFYTDNEYVFKAIVAADSIQRFDQNIYIYHLGVTGQSVGAEGLKKHHSDTIKVLSKMYRIYEEFTGTSGGEGAIYGGRSLNDSFSSDEIRNSREAKLRFLQKGLIFIADLVFVAYLVTGTPEAKSELKDFDTELRDKYKEIDGLIGSNKKIKALRVSGFLLYGVLSKQVRKRYS